MDFTLKGEGVCWIEGSEGGSESIKCHHGGCLDWLRADLLIFVPHWGKVSQMGDLVVDHGEVHSIAHI